MNGEKSVDMYNWVLFSKKKEWSTDKTKMNFKIIMLSEKKS